MLTKSRAGIVFFAVDIRQQLDKMNTINGKISNLVIREGNMMNDCL